MNGSSNINIEATDRQIIDYATSTPTEFVCSCCNDRKCYGCIINALVKELNRERELKRQISVENSDLREQLNCISAGIKMAKRLFLLLVSVLSLTLCSCGEDAARVSHRHYKEKYDRIHLGMDAKQVREIMESNPTYLGNVDETTSWPSDYWFYTDARWSTKCMGYNMEIKVLFGLGGNVEYKEFDSDIDNTHEIQKILVHSHKWYKR